MQSETTLSATLQAPISFARRCWIDPLLAHDLGARCAVALQTSADYTVVASVTAARLHGLWLPTLPDDLHLATAQPGTAGRQMTRTRRPQFVAHRFQLRAEDVTTVNGIAVTSLARTWRDLGRVLRLPDLVAAGDSALRCGVSLEELRAVLDAVRHAPQLAGVRRALPLLDARSRSRPESHLRVAASFPGLPRFAVNEPISRREGGWLAEPDLSLAEARIALEYQGADHAAIARMRRDITRAADLRRESWLTLFYGPAEVFGRPWEITADVHAAVRERAPHLLPGRHPRTGRSVR